MTDYVKTTWVDGTTPAISATNLNHLEDGIESAHSELAAGSAAIPIGVIIPFAGTTAPTGWLLCDGLAVSRTTYASLFALIGETWGEGDNSKTFNVPDLRGRSPIGYTGTRPVGTYGGAESHTHGTDSGGGHSHTITPGSASGTLNANTTTLTTTAATSTHTHGGAATLSGGTHSHTTSATEPPYQATHYIIKAA